MIDSAKARRESMRWTILLTLNNARPIGAHEHLIRTTIMAIYPDVTPHELRVQLDYLSDRRLIEIERDPSGPWRAELSRCGIDLVEYTIPCEPGIARPEKYWEG